MRQQLKRSILLHRKESIAQNLTLEDSILHHIINLKLLS